MTPGEWRDAVLSRDGCCVACGARSPLCAHHVVFKSHCAKQYRTDPRNGVTLCDDFAPNHCHRSLHDGKLQLHPVWLPNEVLECLAEQGLRWIDGIPAGPCAHTLAAY